MATSINEEMFDQRVVARHIARGLVSKNDLQKHLDALEDCADLGEECETQFSYRLETDEAADASSES